MILQNLPNGRERLASLQQKARFIRSSGLYPSGAAEGADLFVNAASSVTTVEQFELLELAVWRIYNSPILVVKLGVGGLFLAVGLGLGYAFTRSPR